MPLLEIHNLQVEFQTSQGALRALEGIDMSVDAGEILGVVGESGSGKSVTMLAVMGLLPWTARITADRLTFDGRDLLSLTPKARRRLIGSDIAMIFQEPMTSLNPSFTVGFQIMEALATHRGGSRRQRRERTIELFRQVGIPAPADRLKAFPHQLSGGMNQRVMIAMAIACNPRLLIADEPTTALDVTIQAQILDLLVSLQRDHGMGLVLITHDMGVVAETAERVCVMYAGQQAEERPAASLFDNPRHPYTAALLDALPERSRGDRLPTIPGVVPGLADRPTGCVFEPRCRFAEDYCRARRPAFDPDRDGRVRCHFPLDDGQPTDGPEPARQAIET
ncbi:ABC transporter ATP-binding protein [Salinisphaera sp. RV14]|uniref:ABC transporter ATP-binding protein n=1 Tax=unclassified Salinisphaera TaxID=2649847 RepID=UPI003F83C4DF